MRGQIALFLVLWLGCSSTANQQPDGGGATGGAGGSSGGSGGASGGGGAGCPTPPNVIVAPPACNTVANSAHAVPFTARTGTPPAPAGGPIRDGVYVSTAAEGYGAVTPAGRRITLAITGGATQMLWTGEVLDATASAVTLSFTANTHIVTASGNQIAFTVDCSSATPSPIPAALTYTASGDQLIMSLQRGADTAVTTYTRTGCLGGP